MLGAIPSYKQARADEILVTRMLDLEACLRGDKTAWDTFVNHAAPIVFSAVRRTLRHYDAAAGASDAEDMAQDVFVRLVKDDFRLLRSYDAGRSALGTWLTLISRSTTIDHLRRRKAPTVPLDAVGEPQAPAAEPAGEGALRELAVPPDLLSARQQLVLRLLFDDGLSVEEAAETLRVEPQTIRSTKHKAILKLRVHFGGDAPSPPSV